MVTDEIDPEVGADRRNPAEWRGEAARATTSDLIFPALPHLLRLHHGGHDAAAGRHSSVSMTTVVADTGDMEAMEKFQSPGRHDQPVAHHRRVADAAVSADCGRRAEAGARKPIGRSAPSDKDVANLAFQNLAVEFGKKILKIVPGRVSTEVDARLSYDTEKDD
jgi:hypothetical protein